MMAPVTMLLTWIVMLSSLILHLRWTQPSVSSTASLSQVFVKVGCSVRPNAVRANSTAVSDIFKQQTPAPAVNTEYRRLEPTPDPEWPVQVGDCSAGEGGSGDGEAAGAVGKGGVICFRTVVTANAKLSIQKYLDHCIGEKDKYTTHSRQNRQIDDTHIP